MNEMRPRKYDGAGSNDDQSELLQLVPQYCLNYDL